MLLFVRVLVWEPLMRIPMLLFRISLFVMVQLVDAYRYIPMLLFFKMVWLMLMLLMDAIFMPLDVELLFCIVHSVILMLLAVIMRARANMSD
jgi:hypothetical protein